MVTHYLHCHIHCGFTRSKPKMEVTYGPSTNQCMRKLVLHTQCGTIRSSKIQWSFVVLGSHGGFCVIFGCHVSMDSSCPDHVPYLPWWPGWFCRVLAGCFIECCCSGIAFSGLGLSHSHPWILRRVTSPSQPSYHCCTWVLPKTVEKIKR